MTTTQIVLLRAVNVGGTGKVAMAALRDALVEHGYDRPRTLLQSGNVVLGATGAGGAALERRLEDELTKTLGLRTTIMVRSAKEWAALIAANPLRADAERAPSQFQVFALKAAPATGAEAKLAAAVKGRETVRVVGHQAYVVFPDGIGRSKLTTDVIERALGTPVTGRNWNTVLKLAALAGA